MKRHNNLSARAKLILGFGVLWVLLAAVILVAYVGINDITQSEKGLRDVEVEIDLQLKELRVNQNYDRAQTLDMMLTSNRSDQEAIEESITVHAQEADANINGLIALDPDPVFQSDLQDLKNNLAAWRGTRAQEVALINAGKVEEARQLATGIGTDQFEKVRMSAVAMEDKATRAIAQQIAQDQQAAQSSVRLFVVIGVIAFLVSLGMIALLSQTIASPLAAISRAAEQIATGDLSVTIPGAQRTDEVGVLAQAFRRLVENLRRYTTDLSQAASQLASTASEILAASTQVASRTAATATAIRETTATVAQVRQAALLSAEQAKLVSGTAQRVAQISETGQQGVEETFANMNRIRVQVESIAQTIVHLSEQGQSIGGIIASVTDLADQSNLLAINAAIEAAKAGEQGKGFAVVAQEIKSLAEQSKQATAQVRGILGDVQKATSAAVMATEQGSKAVDAGVKQSAQAGEAIRLLAETSGQATDTATQVVVSSQRQVVGMDQIRTTMESMTQTGTQNAISMTHVEDAAQSLHELGLKLRESVEHLKESVEQFKL